MFEFKRMDAESLEATTRAWNEQLERLGVDVPASHYQRILNWVEQWVANPAANVYWYLVARESAPNEAAAMLEITHAHPNSNNPWLKLLQIHIEPQLDIACGEEVPVVDLGKIASAALVEALGLTYEQHPSSQLKVYGREPLTLDFLEGLSVGLAENGIKVAMRGNWLVMEKI